MKIKNFFKYLIMFLLGIIFAVTFSTAAANTVCLVRSGCTGVATITGIPYGTGTSPLGIVTVSTGLNFTGGVLTATGSALQWGLISGTLSNQTDLQSALNAKQNTLSIGNLTDAGTDGITVTNGTGSVIGSGTSFAQHVADTSHAGYLASADWNTFNGKQASGSYLTALTGDGTASGPGSSALTLATVNTNTGSFGSSTSIPSFTVNGKGLITAASGNVVIAPAGTLTGTTLASNVLTSSLTTLGTIGTGIWQGNPVGTLYGGTGSTAGAWLLGGNTLGVKTTLGSIDNYAIGFLTNNTEKMTILASGNVGIGTTSPTSL